MPSIHKSDLIKLAEAKAEESAVMAEDALVTLDVERGAALVQALDREQFPVVAALWMYVPELEAWRLVLATPKAKSLRAAYTEIRGIAERAKLDAPDLAQIRLVLPDDPTIAMLSKAIRVEGLGGVRFSQAMIDGIYVDDAYIYRAAA
jgi:hypothetical protein